LQTLQPGKEKSTCHIPKQIKCAASITSITDNDNDSANANDKNTENRKIVLVVLLMVGWSLTALSAQKGYNVPCRN